jgi:pantoate--beta-alanine ligase
LANNDHTIVSIFVNPAQFAPHEDLSTYPRTLESDIEKLAALAKINGGVSALFLPPVSALYPSGITTEVSKQRGAFVEVKGLQEVMEGVSRPAFFRGVATVVIKLFNIVQVSQCQMNPGSC